MKHTIRHFTNHLGKPIIIESKEFTDKELDAMPESHRKSVLLMRAMAKDSLTKRM